MTEPWDYTSARILKTTHKRVNDAVIQLSAQVGRKVTVREMYSAMVELALQHPGELKVLLESRVYEDGES